MNNNCAGWPSEVREGFASRWRLSKPLLWIEPVLALGVFLVVGWNNSCVFGFCRCTNFLPLHFPLHPKGQQCATSSVLVDAPLLSFCFSTFFHGFLNETWKNRVGHYAMWRTWPLERAASGAASNFANEFGLKLRSRSSLVNWQIITMRKRVSQDNQDKQQIAAHYHTSCVLRQESSGVLHSAAVSFSSSIHLKNSNVRERDFAGNGQFLISYPERFIL